MEPVLSRRQRRQARTRGERWRRRRRPAAVAVVLLALAVVALNLADTQVRTPVGAAGVGQGTFPVVEVAGLGSDGAHFAALTKALQAEGVPVLDFDPGRAGTQPLIYEPGTAGVSISASTHVPDLAVGFVVPQIRAALTRAGLDPDTQKVDVVTHSLGGLLMRYLVEKGGWADRVDDLVMVGTPNHGSDVVYWETRFGPFQGLGSDMRPGSAFLDGLGYAEPVGQTWTAIGGDPWGLRWFRSGHHGLDDQVPAESPFVTGAAVDTFPSFHGRLLLNASVVSLVTATLRAD